MEVERRCIITRENICAKLRGADQVPLRRNSKLVEQDQNSV